LKGGPEGKRVEEGRNLEPPAAPGRRLNGVQILDRISAVETVCGASPGHKLGKSGKRGEGSGDTGSLDPESFLTAAVGSGALKSLRDFALDHLGNQIRLQVEIDRAELGIEKFFHFLRGQEVLHFRTDRIGEHVAQILLEIL